MKRRALSILVLLLAAGPARGDDTHYQNFITGGRSVGLGGAFTAFGNDPSGLLFNPSGMVDDRHTDISLSSNLYGYDRSVRGAVGSPLPELTNLNALASELVIVPSVSGLVRTFQKDPGGDGYLNALGAVVLVPSFRSISEVSHRDDTSGHVEYRHTGQDRLLMPGIGYARKLGKFRLGLSTFYVMRSMDSTETVTRSSALAGGAAKVRFADNTLSLSTGSLLFVAGGKWNVADAFQLGASIAIGTSPIISTGRLRYQSGGADPTQAQPAEQGSYRQIGLDRLSSGYRYPTTLRAGGAYIVRDTLTIAADLSLHLPLRYSLFKLSDPALTRSLPFVNDVEREAVVNINTGVEWLVHKALSLSGGFFTDFASSPSLSGPRFAGPLDRQYLEHADYYGFSGVLGLFSANTLTRVGLLYSFGRGYDVMTDGSERLLTAAPQFTRVEVFKSFLYVFVSSTVRFD